MTTINEAVKEYKKDPISEDDKNLFAFLRKTPSGVPLKNSEYDHALRYTAGMFIQAEKTVNILGGPFCCGFLDHLQKEFSEMVDRLKKAGGSVRILLIGNADVEPAEVTSQAKKIQEQYSSDVVGVRAACIAKNPTTNKNMIEISHLVTCDGIMARNEEPHETLTGESNADKVSAEVYFNNPEKAEELNAVFEGFWNILTPNSEVSTK